MLKILSPIEQYGETGIAMATGDGVWDRCHLILATFVGDYPLDGNLAFFTDKTLT